jgi:hypothetical protein
MDYPQSHRHVGMKIFAVVLCLDIEIFTNITSRIEDKIECMCDFTVATTRDHNRCKNDGPLLLRENKL